MFDVNIHFNHTLKRVNHWVSNLNEYSKQKELFQLRFAYRQKIRCLLGSQVLHTILFIYV